MRPKSGKKGSRGGNGSKKEAKANAKRGGHKGRGGSKAGGRMGRRLSFENGPKKTKLSGKRKGDLTGTDLRFTPVLFVKAVEDFELTLETKPDDEDSEHLEPVEGPTGTTLKPDDARAASVEAADDGMDSSGASPHSASAFSRAARPDEFRDESPAADSLLSESSLSPTPASDAASTENLAPAGNTTPANSATPVDDATPDSNAAHVSAPASDAAPATAAPVIRSSLTYRLEVRQNGVDPDLKGFDSDSDLELLDRQLEAQFNGEQYEAAPQDAPSHIGAPVRERTEAVQFDESVSRLAIDSSSDSDDQTPFEYDQYNAFDVDESIFESLSDDGEPDISGVTYDDYDLSDMRAGLRSDNSDDDDDDHMEELDDDQIFALASMASRRVNEYDELDESGFDKYDEFDEYFDRLLDRSTEVPPSAKQRSSESRRLKREARELLRSMDFEKSPVLWRKYPEYIGIKEVLDEIRNFAMQREFQSLSFPPLDKNANWYVKQLAREHGLRPTVEGHASYKHVICHLTGRATPQGGKGVNRLLGFRKSFHRVDAKPVGGKQKGRAPGTTGARVRDGHIVGQHALEISNDNFGHRLMQQMGWSEGSGLGKGREGIIAPIPATVKLTKTGLGA